MEVSLWSIDKPIPYEKNARKWSPAAIEKVAMSIKTYGFRQPIVCDAKNVIVIGHLRLEAAKHLGLEKVPVHVAKDLSPAQIKGLRLADNRTSQESSWDFEMLGEEFEELKDLDFDLAWTGFDPFEIDPIMAAEWTPGAATGDLGEEHHRRVDPSVSFTAEEKAVIDSAISAMRDRESDPELTEGRALMLICGEFLGDEGEWQATTDAESTVGLPS